MKYVIFILSCGQMTLIAGIDIGATNLRTALVTDSGEILESHSEKTDAKNLMEQIYAKLDSFKDFAGIGIASVGPLNSKKGIITNPPNIEIRNLEITKMLEGRYGKRCYLFNDCVAAVLGEQRFGAGRSVENLVYLTLSTGIGCGVIADNRVILGKDGNAHEVGHYAVDLESELKCGCGSNGHWEAYCSGKNIPSFAKYLLNKKYAGRKTLLSGTEDRLTAQTLFEMAKTDEVASEIIGEIGRINAVQVANIINSYDPELITIGGSVALNNSEAILGPILEHVKRHAINRLPDIKITPLGKDAGIYGAAAGFIYNSKDAI